MFSGSRTGYTDSVHNGDLATFQKTEELGTMIGCEDISALGWNAQDGVTPLFHLSIKGIKWKGLSNPWNWWTWKLYTNCNHQFNSEFFFKIRLKTVLTHSAHNGFGIKCLHFQFYSFIFISMINNFGHPVRGTLGRLVFS